MLFIVEKNSTELVGYIFSFSWGNTQVFNKANLRDLFKSSTYPFKGKAIKLKSFDQSSNLLPFPKGSF